MRLRNKETEYIYWILLLIMGIASLYTALGVLGILVSLVLLFFKYRKKCQSNSDKVLLIIILYLPFYTLFRLTLLEVGLVFFSGIYNYFRDFLVLVLLLYMYLRNPQIALKRYDAVWILFILNWILGFVLSFIYDYTILGISGVHLTVIPMLLYIVVAYDRKIKIDTEFVTDIYIKIAFVCAITGLFYYYSRQDYYKTLFTLAGNTVDPSIYVRFCSVFFTPNVCGCFFAIAFFLAFVKAIKRKSNGYAILTGIFGCCVILTLSRGAWLFVAMGLLVYLYLLKPKVGLMVSVPIFIFLCYGTIINWEFSFLSEGMGDIIINRLQTLFNSNDETSYGRLRNWGEALALLKKSPIGYGIGVGSTAQVSREIETGIAVIDGFYMKCIVETGVVGVLYVIGLVLWIVKKYFLLAKNNKSEISYIALFVGCGFLCQALGSNPFDFVCTAPYVWILLGLAERDMKVRR